MSEEGKEYTVRVTKNKFEVIREREGPIDLNILAPHLVKWGEGASEYLSEGKVNGNSTGM